MQNKNLDFLTIVSPCTQKWDTMPGDDRKRFCGQCQLYVHNLTEYSKSEIEELVGEQDLESTRLCALIKLDKKGRMVTSNCPLYLRKYRQRVLAVKTAIILFLVTRGLLTEAFAQGLIGAPVSPGRLGQAPLTVFEEACGTLVSDPQGALAMTLAAVSALLSTLAVYARSKVSLILSLLLCGAGAFAISFVTMDILNFCTGWEYSQDYFSSEPFRSPMSNQMQISTMAGLIAAIFGLLAEACHFSTRSPKA